MPTTRQVRGLGLTDALAQEVEPLGIRVTSVLSGLFATDWSGRSQARTESRIPDYRWSADREPPEMTGHLTALAGAVMTLLDAEDPPLRLLVGPTAVKMIRDRLHEQLAEIDRWNTSRRSTPWADRHVRAGSGTGAAPRGRRVAQGASHAATRAARPGEGARPGARRSADVNGLWTRR